MGYAMGVAVGKVLLGGVLALAMAGVGLFWWQGRAEVERRAPPALAQPEIVDTGLPTADAEGAQGVAPPEAAEQTREQRRFARYDRNHDGIISRNEMLSTRTAAFKKLDKDGNNLLSFEEWAAATADRFDAADTNHDGSLSRAEFAATRPKPVKKAKCSC